MSFVVVIPDMDMDHSDHLATSVHACEPWRRHVANVPAKQHAYLMGLQVINPDDPLITPDDPLTNPDDPLITPAYWAYSTAEPAPVPVTSTGGLKRVRSSTFTKTRRAPRAGPSPSPW